jgi:hypothetical protein
LHVLGHHLPVQHHPPLHLHLLCREQLLLLVHLQLLLGHLLLLLGHLQLNRG